MGKLSLQHVTKTFANGIDGVRDVSFDVPDGAFCVLLGPSGCGKSTTLRMVAGLESVTSGTIAIDGRAIDALHPKDRDIAMVFQNYALYPHLTVSENIAFPLRMRGIDRDKARARAANAAEVMQLTDLLERRPAQLSGGQRQRVAVARAIVRDPRVFLFDEPLSNLDARMRMQTRNELRTLHQRLRVTSLYVTHDQEEALSLADIIVVMAGGRVRQVGTPADIFDRPGDRFVAGFVGTPAMNFLDAVAVANGTSPTLDAGGFLIHAPALSIGPGQRGVIGVRPSNVSLDPACPGSCVFQAEVESVEYLGDITDVTLVAGLHRLTARASGRRDLRPADKVELSIHPKDCHVFDPGPDGRLLGRAGLTVSCGVPALTK
jgi:multiple sugar transport system ATP-binding protein